MGAQAVTDLDFRLTQLYSEKITVNLDTSSTLSPEDFWKSMQVIATNNKAFLNIARR